MKSESCWISVSLICFINLFCSGNLFSQAPAVNDSFYSKALQNSLAVYHQSFGRQSALYNGRLYNEYAFRFEDGQPCFYANKITAGAVVYDGILYDSILMKYDEVADALIINSEAGNLQLWNEKVQSFHLYNADFIQPEKDSNTNGLKFSGFYNLLYKGKVSLLKKEIKTIREAISSELLRFVDTKDYYYIKKNEHYYAVSSRKDFYKILGDHKEEVKQFVKTNKLSFRKDRQNMLTKATAYYDSLK
jgi:hypothetical protein